MESAPFREAREELRAGRRPVRDELGFTGDDIVVGLVSRLEPRKGWTYFLEAVERLAPDFPALRALIVGEGAQRAELEAEVRRRGLEQRVVFAGFRSDVARAIAAMDVAVLTSLWEGLPRVLVQYALLERPIVAFEVEGSREVIADGHSGYVVGLRDVDALVTRLRPLVANAELRRTFGERVRQHVEGRWDVEIMVDRIERLYDEVAAVPTGD
jgi:glycosyltransferase involved in cell wall biosynthesis